MNCNFFRNKKNITFFLFMVLILVLDVVFVSKFIYSDTSYYIDNYASSQEKYIAEGNVVFEQEFIGTRNELEAVTIGFDKDFRTYNDEQINIKVIDVESGKVLGEYNNIYQEIVKSYKEYKFKFEKQKDSQDKRYRIVVEYQNGTENNPILYNSIGNESNGELQINGEKVPYNISFKAYYNSRYANVLFGVALTTMSIVSMITIALCLYKSLKIEKAFIVLVACIGIIYVFTVPIYRGHDEHAHFFRAYEISKGVFNTKIIDNKSVTSIPNAFEATTVDTGKYCNETSYKQVLKFLSVNTVDGENFYEGASYMAVYSPIPYLPQAITIFFLDIFTDNVAIMFYGARIANLIVAIVILYFAIKIIPFGKNAILYIVLIPTTIAQLASMSPDAMTIASCILFMAYFLKMINEKNTITKKNICVLTVLGIIVALCKIVYIPLVLLTLLIPTKQFNSKKLRIINTSVMVIVPIIINFVWLKIAGTHLELIDNNKSSIQTNFILANILEYIRIAIYTLENCFGQLITELFGGVLLHNDLVNNGMIVTLIMVIVLIFVVLFDSDLKGKLSTKMVTLVSVILFVISGAIATSLYVQWSPYKWYFINGIQGRYFVALLLPFIFVLGQNKLIQQKKKINILSLIEYSAIIVNFISIMQIVLRFI